MKIAITSANSDKIEAALKAVNGGATGHTINHAWEIENLAREAQATLNKLLAPSSHHGARLQVTSGERVANSYRNARTATHVELTHGAKHWYLTAVQRTSVYPSGGCQDLSLTREQDKKAIARLRAAYSVAA